MPKVRYLPVSEGWQVNIESFPNFDKSGSISGMKKKYYGKDALLVRCGYNVSLCPNIYYRRAY